jgi:hypothetical protein
MSRAPERLKKKEHEEWIKWTQMAWGRGGCAYEMSEKKALS